MPCITMAIISTFLCWRNTRQGSAVCGYYTLVISVVCLAFYMLRYIALDEIKDSIELKGIVYAGFVLYSFLIGVSLILLPGVYMDRKLLLLPWIYVLVITVLYETGAVALITTVHLEQDPNLNAWEIVAVAFYCLRLIANCYCFACVVSQYQELSEGRGTYEFLYKPWHLRRGMRGGQSLPVDDFDDYNTPYGAALPPYSEENQFKEFSPPLYDNLATDYEEIDAMMLAAGGRGSRGHSRSGSRSSGGHRLTHATSSSYLADIVVNNPPREPDRDCQSCGGGERRSGNDGDTASCGACSGDFEVYSTVIPRQQQHCVRNPNARDTDEEEEDSGEEEVLKYITDLRALRSSRSMGDIHRENLQQISEPDIPHRHYHHNRTRQSHQGSSHHQHSHSLDCSEYARRSNLSSGQHQASVHMTASSACLLGRSSPAHGRRSPSQLAVHQTFPKRTNPISPLTIQKRTYITWI